MLKRVLILLLILVIFELLVSKAISATLGAEVSLFRDVLVPLAVAFRDFVRWVVT